jgi:hypothetical protein
MEKFVLPTTSRYRIYFLAGIGMLPVDSQHCAKADSQFCAKAGFLGSMSGWRAGMVRRTLPLPLVPRPAMPTVMPARHDGATTIRQHYADGASVKAFRPSHAARVCAGLAMEALHRNGRVQKYFAIWACILRFCL